MYDKAATMMTVKRKNRQSGAALVIGLLLLVVITVLAISGMNTATTELAIARNDQSYETAFQAAETGLEKAIAQGRFNTKPKPKPTIYETNNKYPAKVTVTFEEETPVPDRAFSLGGGSGISAYHFLATSHVAATTDRDSSADSSATHEHTQAFYIVGPESPMLRIDDARNAK